MNKLVISEKQVMKEVKQWLDLKGFLCYRMNTGAASYTDQHGRNRFVKFGSKGMADFMVLHDGHAIFLELKGSQGKQTYDQRNFQSDVELAGCSYAVVKGSRDVEEFFTKIGVEF